MGKDDWYRNAYWNSEIESQFMAKLQRARDKSQYLRIQANYLAKRDPKIALLLLKQYFELGDHFDIAQAHVDQATAYIALGMMDQAIEAYEAALNRESDFPKLLTNAYLDLPYLIVTQSIESKFFYAMTLLDGTKHRPMFPIDRYKWNAAKAFLTAHSLSASEAQTYAQAALEAANQEKSGLRYHPNVGLFSKEKTDKALYDTIKQIALRRT